MQVTRKSILFGIAALALIAAGWGLRDRRPAAAKVPGSDRPEEVAQQGPTSTPAPVNLPSPTATNPPDTLTPSRTPTNMGPALLEARNPDTNVRAEPDITANRLGQIQPGAQYVVRGRRFEWYQIDYPDTPTHIGWVHQSVVNIIGDASLIPEIDPALLPTTDPTLAARQETAIAATQTPGGLLTLTAQVLVTPEGLFTTEPGILGVNVSTLAPGERLPTFTFPPFTDTPISIQELQNVKVTPEDSPTGFPPIIPVLGLGALGLMGLLVGILKRL